MDDNNQDRNIRDDYMCANKICAGIADLLHSVNPPF